MLSVTKMIELEQVKPENVSLSQDNKTLLYQKEMCDVIIRDACCMFAPEKYDKTDDHYSVRLAMSDTQSKTLNDIKKQLKLKSYEKLKEDGKKNYNYYQLRTRIWEDSRYKMFLQDGSRMPRDYDYKGLKQQKCDVLVRFKSNGEFIYPVLLQLKLKERRPALKCVL
jgi:hypothetical protein